MQCIKNKIFKLFITLCAILPLHGMLPSKTFNKLKEVQRRTAQQQKRYFQPPQPIKTPKIKRSTPFSWFSNWWYGPPLEEKLSNWSTNISTAIQTTPQRFSMAMKSKKQNAQNFDIDDSYAETASYKHFKKFRTQIIENYPEIFSDYFFTSMIHAAIKKEKEENDFGKETFFYGRGSENKLPSDLYTMFFEYKAGKKLNNFIFLQLTDPVLEKINPYFFEYEKGKREQLLKETNFSSDALLFLNEFLFGNAYHIENNAISSVRNNIKKFKEGLLLKDVFSMFGYADIYEQYAQKLQELQQEYNNLSKYGELLLIAVPKNRINKCIVYTNMSGTKKEFDIPGIGKTTDTEKIVEYYKNNPEDEYENDGHKFAGIATRDKDGILSDDSKTEVFSFDAIKPKKKKTFEAKKNILFAQIMKSVKEKDAKKTISLRSRE